ncbi:MAG: type II toxin-antitoxin system RelE/ParE family toxin [Planctomycetes bacterium]|nr:type II toxin-antitoxin system RelE/ParE family toxin [Planctomycetota bacterium]
MRSIHFRIEARVDVLEAFAYLEGRRAGLGARFLESLDVATDRLLDLPMSGVEVKPGVRRVITPVFRYRLFYIVEDAQVVVLAVHHPSRDSKI